MAKKSCNRIFCTLIFRGIYFPILHPTKVRGLNVWGAFSPENPEKSVNFADFAGNFSFDPSRRIRSHSKTPPTSQEPRNLSWRRLVLRKKMKMLGVLKETWSFWRGQRRNCLQNRQKWRIFRHFPGKNLQNDQVSSRTNIQFTNWCPTNPWSFWACQRRNCLQNRQKWRIHFPGFSR